MYPHDSQPAFREWVVEGPAPTEWEGIVAWQRGRCAMCGTDRQRLVEDHDHRTGMSRGILCWSCNVCEGVVEHEAWDAWRAGGNPATDFGVERRYPGRTYADDEWTAEDQEKLRRGVAGIRVA